MPNTHSNLTSLFTDIANAIRGKTGSSETIVADNFPTAIANISTGAPDGHSWTRVELPITPWKTTGSDTATFGYVDIAYGAGKYAILVNGANANYSKIIYSTDLVNWTTLSFNGDIQTRYTQKYEWLVYGNGRFVLMHSPGTEQQADFACTTDFEDELKWSFSKSSVNFEEFEFWQNFFFAGSKFIAVCDQGTAAVSSDGSTWSQSGIQGDAVYAGDEDLAIWVPSENWANINIIDCVSNFSGVSSYPFPDAPSGYTYQWPLGNPIAGNGKYIGGVEYRGSNDYLIKLVVYDRLKWSTVDLHVPATNSSEHGVYGNGKYMLFGEGYICTSKDALNWTITNTTQLNNVGKVVYGNGAFVGLAVEENNTKLVIYYSRTTNDY